MSSFSKTAALQHSSIAMIFAALLVSMQFMAWGQDARASQGGKALEIGTVTGQVYDAQTGQVIRGAAIQVVGTSQKIVTDLDGRYTVKLPEGIYSFTVSKEGYFDQPMEKVAVSLRQTAYLDPLLVSKTSLTLNEKVVVEAESPESASLNSVMLERRTTDKVADFISAEEIAKNADGNAAAVLERVTGISVVQDKYVFVRGLGERYSSTLLNGSALPSTEPERKDVPFDLFQASLINKITTLKTFTPDQSGDFSGGLVKIETTEFPPEFMMKYSVGVDYDTNVSTKSFLTYPGTHLDWLGFGYEHRKMPESFPPGTLTPKNPYTGAGFTPQQLQGYGRDLRNVWEPDTRRAFPGLSQGFMSGGTWGKLGTVVSLTYSRDFSRLTGADNSYVLSGGTLKQHNEFINDRNTESAKIGLVANIAYKLTDNHKLQLKNFWTQDSGNEVRVLTGMGGNTGTDDIISRLRYTQERIFNTQLTGEHFLPVLGNSLLEWRMSYSRAGRREPDLRENVYSSEEGKGQYLWSASGQSGYRQFSHQFDNIYEPGVDWTYFLVRGNLVTNFKIGSLYHYRTRDFDTRRFTFKPVDYRNIDRSLPPEKLFAPENIAPDRFELREVTRSSDAYDANHRIWAGYGMADVTLNKQWRFVGGVRYERSNQFLTAFNPTSPTLGPIVVNPIDSDFLPAANVIYSVKPNMNIRGAYSRTLNRPELRELAPFQFTDISGKNTIIGNSALHQAAIDNYDLRWEWFRKGGDLLAASLFYKNFQNPIERIQMWAADPLITWENTEKAHNQGLELEVRKNLGFLASRLSGMSFYGNYSRIFSEVDLGDITGNIATSRVRPLQGQASYMVNAVLEWELTRTATDLRLLYNVVGPRISLAGTGGAPDVIEITQHYLDFTFSQRLRWLQRAQLRFSVQNLLNRAITQTQGGWIYNQDRMGRTFALSLSYDIY